VDSMRWSRLSGGSQFRLVVALLFGAGFCLPLLADGDEVGIPRLHFEFGKPKAVTIYPGQDVDLLPSGEPRSGRTYWYLPYTLTNRSGLGASFFVTVRGSSDKGKKYSDLALPWVERKIERMEQKRLWSKVDLLANGQSIDAYSEFKPGAKKACVAIFNPIDPEADKITIDVHGLIDDFEVEELAGGALKITERVLRLSFERPGDEFFTSMDSFKFKSKAWVKISREIPAS